MAASGLTAINDTNSLFITGSDVINNGTRFGTELAPPQMLTPYAGELAPADLASCSPRDDDFARRIYVIAGPILLTLGLIGNFAIIAILSKQRFRPFPITTLIKSHAIANIFCLFIGLFLGDYIRALSNNFSFQHQFGIWGCRLHLTLTYALSYVTSWHYAALSGARLLMALSPSFYTSGHSRTMARGAIAVIIGLALMTSGHIFWSVSFQEKGDPSPPEAIINATIAKPSCRPTICAVRDDAESFYASWKIVDLAAAIVIPLTLVTMNLIALPLIIQRRQQATSHKSILPAGSSPLSYRQKPRRRRSSSIDVVTTNLASMLYYQDLLFVVLSVPLLVYFLLFFFPRSMVWQATSDDADSLASTVETLRFIYPFANLLQYSTNVATFLVFAFCSNNKHRTPVPSPSLIAKKPKLKNNTKFRVSYGDVKSAGTKTAPIAIVCSLTTSEEMLQSSPLRYNNESSLSEEPDGGDSFAIDAIDPQLFNDEPANELEDNI